LLLAGYLLTGAQALVAWALQRADPSVKLSMVAEEDSADLM
jgi:3'(2'), 5'-bisphosphate nucleotidase/inositol polyphosphate 1-phosphatase